MCQFLIDNLVDVTFNETQYAEIYEKLLNWEMQMLIFFPNTGVFYLI